MGRICVKLVLHRKRRRARHRDYRISEPLGRESSLHRSAAEMAAVFDLAVVTFAYVRQRLLPRRGQRSRLQQVRS